MRICFSISSICPALRTIRSNSTGSVGRIIGKDGRAREQIENMTDVDLSVFGHTVSLIGYPEQMKIARAAIDMLIEGVPHENVFAFLDKKKKEAKQDMISYYY